MSAANSRSTARRGALSVCALVALIPLLAACGGVSYSSEPVEKSDFERQLEADEHRRSMEEQEAESLRRQAENLSRLQAIADQQASSSAPSISDQIQAKIDERINQSPPVTIDVQPPPAAIDIQPKYGRPK